MKRFNITVNGVTYDVAVEETGAVAPASVPAAPAPAAASAPAPAPAAEPAKTSLPAEGTKVGAPMPGSIVDVCVAVGDQVKVGDRLIVLESMKMENDIVSALDGTVTGIGVAKGDMVNAGDTLVVIG